MNFDFDFGDSWHYLRDMLLAFVLALPIGWDRERNGRSLGFRTFPLIATSSCAFVLLATSSFESSDARARVLQGLITGVGFLGGGAIVKQGATVHGTATAASVWATAALGAAVACSRLDIAVTIAVTTFATLVAFRPLKRIITSDE